MAMPGASAAPAPSAQVVGNAFVEQYYHILHQSPELVHKFYQDISLLSRPDLDGSVTTVTTMHAINEKILSLNYGDYTAEIISADAQESYGRGVIVLVTGCLIGKDNVRKKFAQTFFLAPQVKGYFVLNDVFRYVEENESSPLQAVVVNGTNEQAPVVALSTEAVLEPAHTPAPENVSVENSVNSDEEDLNNGAEVCDPSDNEGSVVEDGAVEPPTQSESEVTPVAELAPVAQEDAPKKSYASIVKVMKSNAASASAQVPTNYVKVAKTTTDQPSLGSAKPAPTPSEVSAPASGSSAPESENIPEEAEGHSIYVRNLPYNATPAQLEEAFKKFGPIKPDGIQVRSNKQGFTFGFVEFESSSSMHSALEASPVTIGDRQAVVEEKRTTTRVNSSGRGRYPSGRGGVYRSESFRGRSNFGGGRGYGRNDYRNQSEFSPRARSSTGRNGETYQRVNQNGNGRGGRQGVSRSSLS